MAGSACLLEPLSGGNARLLEVRLAVGQPLVPQALSSCWGMAALLLVPICCLGST